jgi:Putative beta-barrel porin 2
LLFARCLAPAQDAVRQSLAGEAAARARRLADQTEGYYNLHIGPTAWRFGSTLGLEYNDNIVATGGGNLAQAPESDIIFRPVIKTRMNWATTDRNSLNLALGGGYAFYLQHSDFNRYFLNGTELSYDIYVGDFWINLHERADITENSYVDPSVVGSANYSVFQNTLGFSPVLDLGKVILKAGYDHITYTLLQSGSAQNTGLFPDAQNEVVSLSAGYMLAPELQAGLELGGSLLSYSGATASVNYPNSKQWNAGPFLQTPLSEYLWLRVSAGYTDYLPDSTAISSLAGIYGQITASHKVNEYLNYYLSGGRLISSGYGGGSYDMYYVYWQANWKFIRDVTLGTTFVFNHGTQVITGGETFDQIGPGITLSRLVTQKVTASLGYQYYYRTSDLPGRDYTVDIVSLSFTYQF